MFAVDGVILISAVLLLFAIASSKFSTRAGVPVLVVFLALGMLAGSEGIGGIEFEESRPYAPGDDLRTLDWNATARLGEPFVKRRYRS